MIVGDIGPKARTSGLGAQGLGAQGRLRSGCLARRPRPTAVAGSQIPGAASLALNPAPCPNPKPQFGFNGVDNGYLRLDHVRIRERRGGVRVAGVV